MKKKVDDGEFEREDQRIRLGMKHVKTQIKLEISINEINNELQTRIENLERQGSGLVYEKTISMQKETFITNLLKGGSYRGLLANCQAVVNNKHIYEFCAFRSIIAEIFPVTTNENKTSSCQQHFDKLDTSGIDFSNGLRFENISKLDYKNDINHIVIDLDVKVTDDLSVTSKDLPIYFSDTESEPKD